MEKQLKISENNENTIKDFPITSFQNLILKSPKKIKYGMIGGGPDSFIGEIHRIAANMNHNIELKCGSFSSMHEKSSIVAENLNLESYRIYKIYEEMLLEESRLPIEEKIDFIVIVTPNHLH